MVLYDPNGLTNCCSNCNRNRAYASAAGAQTTEREVLPKHSYKALLAMESETSDGYSVLVTHQRGSGAFKIPELR